LELLKAFDTCCKHGILKTLKTWKIDGRLLDFTKNFMNDRTLRMVNWQHDEFTQEHRERGTTRSSVERDNLLGGDG
jgi:hypothetical protein